MWMHLRARLCNFVTFVRLSLHESLKQVDNNGLYGPDKWHFSGHPSKLSIRVNLRKCTCFHLTLLFSTTVRIQMGLLLKKPNVQTTRFKQPTTGATVIRFFISKYIRWLHTFFSQTKRVYLQINKILSTTTAIFILSPQYSVFYIVRTFWKVVVTT